MFESDDFDQILSQFDFPVASSSNYEKIEVNKKDISEITNQSVVLNKSDLSDALPKDERKESLKGVTPCISTKSNSITSRNNEKSPKHLKRKILDSFFDHSSKRKFPGPAGLLSGSFRENNDDAVCQVELLSQDVDFSQNILERDAFDSPLWRRLQEDVKDWNLGSVDTTKAIKQCAIPGHLRKRKAHTVAAFIESVDRSITDPLITLRDFTGTIKCTLHRDAWSTFSPYIVSEYCALVLWKPTILTTGSAFKKHYLNITLSNIFAVYSSAILNDSDNKELPVGYIKVYEEDFTVIKSNKSAQTSGLNSTVESIPDENCLLEGLDNIFSDEIF